MNNKQKHDAIEKELKKIEQKHGTLRPEVIVEFAKNPKTALHSSFEWDNVKAGQEYRLWQARQIISVYVETYRIDGREVNVRAFHSLPSDRTEGGLGYRSIDSILTSEDGRAQMLAEAFAEFERLRKKYEVLNELSEVFQAIDDAKDKTAKKIAAQRVEKVV